ncbi:unnamed protein product [Effrenium voratum]|uniref:Cytochrome b5 heme-binding domain-containing protein n=1 Tax=Effrenium voratum TaxID=2562239 RepID=A0AA36NJF2_9DINO|nr:unnamed protein product [Effrenium voratum]CAJ1406371.1 unnamed protein product [Effrenium voratum]CAJ1421645.1 unnamed protein product [Effrenium voratum]
MRRAAYLKCLIFAPLCANFVIPSQPPARISPGLKARGGYEEIAQEPVLSRDHVASQKTWIVIGGGVYDVAGYLQKHPGGHKVLSKYFYGQDATEAFAATKHSQGAHKLLERFRVGELESANRHAVNLKGSSWAGKLFTREDRFQIHKVLGVYVLLHYLYRHIRVFAGNPTGGFTGSWLSLLMVIPHAMLSLSSLIFHIPRERVAEKPMIWQEFRAHNICFALRSFLCFTLLWIAQHAEMQGSHFAVALRGVCVLGSAALCLGAMRAADWATARLREKSAESTTATMPYWEGCSQRTQGRFKAFYMLAQILATGGCLASFNLFWPFAIMLPIQLASLLMTLVRKGILSTKGYHLIYTASLVVPFFVGWISSPALFSGLAVGGLGLFYLRRCLPHGASSAKYMLWTPVAVSRVMLFHRLGC